VAEVLSGKRSLFRRERLGMGALPKLVDMEVDQATRRFPGKALALRLDEQSMQEDSWLLQIRQRLALGDVRAKIDDAL
jgi:hypothetical protein